MVMITKRAVEPYTSLELRGLLSPKQVLWRESAKPYGGWFSMFGCCEFEMVARNIVRYLAASTNTWQEAINLADMGSPHHLKHHHMGTGIHIFKELYMDGLIVNDLFVKITYRLI